LFGQDNLFGFSRWEKLGMDCSAGFLISFLGSFYDAVGDGGGFDGGADVVGADDVGAGEDGGYVGGSGGLEAVFHGGCCSVEQEGERRMLGEGVGQEAFAGDAGEERQVESVKLVEVGEEKVVFFEAFAEAEAGVENDFVAWNAGGGGGFDAIC
jgi:hypothetical protein